MQFNVLTTGLTYNQYIKILVCLKGGFQTGGKEGIIQGNVACAGGWEHYLFVSTDEDPSLWIESFAIINLCGVSTKLN